MQSSIPYYATPLSLYHKTIYLSTERCTGIYGNNSGTIIGFVPKISAIAIR